MASNLKMKLKLLYLMKILLEKSDERHPLRIADIVRELEVYDIQAERKSIYSDIELLNEFGLDIICEKARENYYYIASRDFEMPELKLLVDAVQASKFITHKKSEELIKKIEKLTSIYEARDLHRQVIVNDRVKTMNESIYYNVDAIHNAIQQNRMVKFKYFDYTVDKQLKFRRNGEIYCVSPYALTWADENYYLIAYHDRYNDISHFRVDRMSEIEISESFRPQISEFEDFNVAEYSKRVFGMFSGESEKVEIEFDNSLINVVINRFGKDVRIYCKTETSFKIVTEVAATGTFFGWLFMFGEKARIVAPLNLIEAMKTYLQSTLEVYQSQ